MTKRGVETIFAIVLCWISIGSSSWAQTKSKVSAPEADNVIHCKNIYPAKIQIPYIKAQDCVREGDLQNAEKYYAEALKQSPPDAQKEILCARGDAYRKFNRPDLAIADYQKYSAITHETKWSTTLIALCYYDQKNYKKVATLLKSLPETKDVVGLRGRIAFHNRHYKEAFKDLDWYCQRNLAPELRTKDDNDCEKLRKVALAKLKEGGH